MTHRALLASLAGLTALALSAPALAAPPEQITWTATASARSAEEAGRTFSYVCPAKSGGGGSAWGTDFYTYDSAICVAAVHAGKIKEAAGGTVTLQIRHGQPKYTGSARNGVTSRDWGAYGVAYSFDIDKGLFAKPGRTFATWATNAKAAGKQVGKKFTYICPPNGILGAPLYGTDVYTHDSAICPAAVHAGKITQAAGGKVTIELKAGVAEHPGSAKNGITSSKWGSYDLSFSFK